MTILGIDLGMLDEVRLREAAGPLWPYIIVLIAAFLPSEIWRWAAVFLSRGLSDQDERIVWVRNVSAALLTCVVVKILIVPTGALATVPIVVRLGSLVIAICASLFFKRSVFIAILVGEVLLIGATLLAP